MKKLFFFLGFLIASIAACAQGVKISAMPILSDQTQIQAGYVPIVYNFVNYKFQPNFFALKTTTITINGDAQDLDGDLNFTVSGGTSARFGVAGEDDAAAETRDFNQAGNTFTIHGADFIFGQGAYTTPFGGGVNYSRIDFAANYQWFRTGDGVGQYTDALFSNPGKQVVFTSGNSSGTSSVDIKSEEGVFISNTTGLIYAMGLANTTTSYVVYYDPSNNGLLTYGAAPSGGSSLRFGVSGEDATQGQARSFDMTGGNYQFTIIGDAGNSSSLWSVSGGASGIYADGTSVGIEGKSASIPLWAVNNSSGTSAKKKTFVLTADPGAAGASGLGPYIQFDTKDAANAITEIGQFGYVMTDATAGSVDADLNFYVVANSTAAALAMQLKSTKQLYFTGYGAGTFTGTAAYDLAVDASGHIIEVTAGGGGSSQRFGVSGEDVSGTANRTFTINGNQFQLNAANSGSGSSYLMANSGTGTTLGVTNNGGSNTLSAQNNGIGGAILGTATSGQAFVGTSTGTSGVARFTATPSSTNSTVTTLVLTRSTSGTAAANMANQLEFDMETDLDGSTTSFSNSFISTWVSAVHASRQSKLIVRGINSASQQNLVEFDGDGNVRQLVTGKGYGLKSPDGTTWYITVSNAGAISASTTLP